MHPPHPPGTGCPPETTAPPPAHRLLPRPDERLAFTNILLLFALPLLAWAAHLYFAASAYDLWLPVQSDRPLDLHVFLNVGAGEEKTDPLTVPVPASPDRPVMARVDVSAGRLLGLRLQFDNAPGATIHLGPASIRARDGGRDPMTVSLHNLRAVGNIPRLDPENGGARVETGPPPHSPAARLDLAQTLVLPFDTVGFVLGFAPALSLYVFTAFGALLAWRRLLRVSGFRARAGRGRAALERGYGQAGQAIRTHPLAALWLAAVAGVALSCYPVVFCGKSFVSPGISGIVLYDRMPTLPGNPSFPVEDTQGGDTLASIVQSIPYAAIERRALLDHGEFPLWNRYNAAAGPLLGQGLSMIGDPLQWIVILGGANSGAWDLKFLLARLLFAAGVGLAVRAATGRLAAALLLAFSACFCGFFVYRFNHPASFGVCYAPWILYAWLEIARGPGAGRQSVRRVGLLLLANWIEFNSGTVKEASMLIAGLNLTGLLAFAFSDGWPTVGAKARALAGLAWAGACFVLVSAPLWHPLLDAITHSWSDYLHPSAWQIQPGLLLGVFDDIFYREFNRDEQMFDPATNFVVLLGVAWAVVSFKTLARGRTFRALCLGSLVPLALVFGVVPPDWIKSLPFLGNISHIDNTFSCVLIVHLLVLAGCGLERCRARLAAPDWGTDLALTAAVVGMLFAAFLGLTHAGQRTDFNPLATMREVRLSAFFQPYVFSLLAALVALPLLGRALRRTRGAGALGLAPWLALCLGALLWRGGQQLHAVVGLERYVVHPAPRVDLRGASPAVERILARQAEEPGRCLGMGDNLVAGFMGSYGLEGISGPDALQNRYYHAMLVDSQLPLLWHWRMVSNRPLVAAVRCFYDMLNVRFYVDGVAGPAPVPLPGTHLLGRDDLDVYESDTVWPRAFFTDALAISHNSKELFSLLGAGDGRPFAAVPPEALAGVDGPSLRPLLRADGGAARAVLSASGYRLGNHTTRFHVRASGPGVATLLEGYQDPGNVRVEINGQPATAFRVDEAFAGVFLPAAGDYEVCFRYGPRDLPLLLGASALGLALLAGTAFRLRRNVREAPVPAGRWSAGQSALQPVVGGRAITTTPA